MQAFKKANISILFMHICRNLDISAFKKVDASVLFMHLKT